MQFDDTRSDWGARKPKSQLFVDPSRRTEFFVHWAGDATRLTASSPHSECLKVVKSFQVYHMNVRGWSDIGYNGLVCPHGRRIEGRGPAVAGAHCTNHNTIGLGFQLMCGVGDPDPTPVMFDAMAHVYKDACAYAGKTLGKFGHRDGMSTDCPGTRAYAWVKAGMPMSIGATTTNTEELNVKLIDLRNADKTLVTGSNIKPLQRLLDVADDGKGGPDTKKALGAAQKRMRLDVDYIFGPKTAEGLLAGK